MTLVLSFHNEQEQVDLLPPPGNLRLDFTLTHTCFGRSHVHSTGQLKHTRCSDGVPESDGGLRSVTRKKILHYHQMYINRPDPIAFIPVAVDTGMDRGVWRLLLT